MSEIPLSPETSRALYRRDAAAYLSTRAGTQVSEDAAQHCIDSGCLYHTGGGNWSLDTTSSALLFAPGCASLIPIATLQTWGSPQARAEISRRMRSVLESDERVVNNIENTSSGDDNARGFDLSELAQLDGFVSRHNEVMANIAAARAGDQARIAEVQKNAMRVIEGGQTDFQRSGKFPGGEAA